MCRFRWLVLWGFVCLTFWTCRWTSRDSILHVLLIGDLYELAPRGDRGGVAYLARRVQQARHRWGKERVLLLHSGDAISPSLVSMFDRGRAMIEALNRLRVDAMVIGNHEFDFDYATLRMRIRESRFPWLAANVTIRGQPIPGTVPYVILERARLRIGVIGVTTPRIRPVDPSWKTLRITDPVRAVEFWLPRVRQHAPNLVVVLSHLDFDDDLRIAQYVDGIHMIAGGHDHFPVLWAGEDLPIVKPGSDARWLGRITWKFHNGRPTYWDFSLETIHTEITPVPAMDRWVRHITRELQHRLQKVVGYTEIALDGRRSTLRTRAAPVGTMVAEAMRSGTGAEIAMVHAGALRWEAVHPPGPITLADIYRLLPYQNRIAVVRLTGRQIREVLEWAVREPGPENSAFLHVSGMEAFIDLHQPVDQRVCAVYVLKGGRRTLLEERAEYAVAIPDYLYGGGMGFHTFRQGQTIVDPESGPGVIELLIEWIRVRSPLRTVPQGFVHMDCETQTPVGSRLNHG